MKGKLEQQVKSYADTFAHWIEVSDRVHPLRALIDIDSQNMLPRADDIIESARNDADERDGGARRRRRRAPAPASSRSASPWSRSASAFPG